MDNVVWLKYERRDPREFCRDGSRHQKCVENVCGAKWKSCQKCGEWLGWVEDGQDKVSG